MIIASTKNGIIGKDNKLPWHIHEELVFFKKTTLNSTLLMGYNTYKSLPGKLPNRKIIVLTRKNLENIKTIKINQINELFKFFRNNNDILFIAGGKMLYESFYNEADIIIHSVIKKKYDGNVKVCLDYANYKLVEEIPFEKFIVKKYKKTNSKI